MSKKEYRRQKVRRSRIIPEEFKEQYENDFKELEKERDLAKEDLKNEIKKLSGNQISDLQAYLSTTA